MSPKRSEHSPADAAELRRLVAAAGFGDISITTVPKTLRFPSVADWVHIQLSASPLAMLLNGQDPTRAELLVDAIVADVQVALCRTPERMGSRSRRRRMFCSPSRDHVSPREATKRSGVIPKHWPRRAAYVLASHPSYSAPCRSARP
jgi:hypothetical protein